jgi:hypothetical protein
MSVELLIANFLRIAAEDLEGAHALALNKNRNAIYLCEQAAEKVIRAVVTSEGKHAGVKHDLAEMVDLIPDENPLHSRSSRAARPSGVNLVASANSTVMSTARARPLRAISAQATCGYNRPLSSITTRITTMIAAGDQLPYP